MRFWGGGCPPPAGREDITYMRRDMIDMEEPSEVETAYVRGCKTTASSAGLRDAMISEVKPSRLAWAG